MDDSEARALELARAGDHRALEELVERHQPQVYRFALGMCRDAEDARDVSQDTFLALARGVRELRGESALSTWLYAVARSFCIKRRRRGKHAPVQVSLDEDPAVTQVAAPAAGPDEALAERRLEQAVREAIAALEPMYREVLVLRDVEGLPAAEVAAIVGARVDAVKSRLHRARLAVRTRVAPLLAAGPEPAAAAGSCPDVLALFSRRLEGEISADTCAEMERHLEGCARCRGACDSLKRTLSACKRAAASEVPASVQTSVKVALRELLSRP